MSETVDQELQQEIADKPAIKGLSLTQPYASFVAHHAKLVETRNWSTPYRGLVAIHAAKGMTMVEREFCEQNPHAYRILSETMGVRPAEARKLLPRGEIVAIAELYDCRPMGAGKGGGIADWVKELSDQERQFGFYAEGRFGFFLRNVLRLPAPIPCTGALNVWAIPVDVLVRIENILPHLPQLTGQDDNAGV